MEDSKLKILYEDKDLLVVDKPAGIIVFLEREVGGKTLIDFLVERFSYLKSVGNPPRFGIIHRLDKETSGILLVAKNDKSLFFFQKQFKLRRVIKKYIALLFGNIKENRGKVETLIGRSPQDSQKQKIFLPFEPSLTKKRKAITEYEVLTRFYQELKRKKIYYTLIEASPKTGRKHQIRTHFSYLGHPVVGDKIYGFKSQSSIASALGLERHFLHAHYLKTRLLDGKEKEFKSDMPQDLKKFLANLNELSEKN